MKSPWPSTSGTRRTRASGPICGSSSARPARCSVGKARTEHRAPGGSPRCLRDHQRRHHRRPYRRGRARRRARADARDRTGRRRRGPRPELSRPPHDGPRRRRGLRGRHTRLQGRSGHGWRAPALRQHDRPRRRGDGTCRARGRGRGAPVRPRPRSRPCRGHRGARRPALRARRRGLPSHGARRRHDRIPAGERPVRRARRGHAALQRDARGGGRALRAAWGPPRPRRRGEAALPPAAPLRGAAALTVPVTVALVASAGPLAALLYGRGAVGPAAVEQIGGLAAVALLSLPAQGANAAFTAVYVADRRLGTAFVINALGLIAFAVVAVVAGERAGPRGIAAAYVALHWTLALVYSVDLRRAPGPPPPRGALPGIATAALVGAAVVLPFVLVLTMVALSPAPAVAVAAAGSIAGIAGALLVTYGRTPLRSWMF